MQLAQIKEELNNTSSNNAYPRFPCNYSFLAANSFYITPPKPQETYLNSCQYASDPADATGDPVNSWDPSGEFDVYNNTSALFKHYGVHLSTSGPQFVEQSGASGWENATNGFQPVNGYQQTLIYSPIIQIAAQSSNLENDIGLVLYTTWFNLYQTNINGPAMSAPSTSAARQFQNVESSTGIACDSVSDFRSFVGCFIADVQIWGNNIGGGSPQLNFPDLSVSWYMRDISSNFAGNVASYVIGEIKQIFNFMGQFSDIANMSTTCNSYV